jgi:hypothetical protein
VNKPARDWTEDDVVSLPLEDDTLERKGSRLLDLTLSDVQESKVLSELAKQLSAFANTGGGRILYGVTDAGQVDNGGVSQLIKGRQSAKDWLESIIPTLTDYEIAGVNVYQISGQNPGSPIHQGKALFVVDVPDSERAPHQSKRDLLYYVRLGGTSRPAPHRLIEDIRNRARHPDIKVIQWELYDARSMNAESRHDTRRQFTTLNADVSLDVRLTLRNLGRIMARNACLLVEGGGATIEQQDYPSIVKSRPAPCGGVYWEWLHPIYPEMEINFSLSCGLHLEKRLSVGAPGAGMLYYRGTDNKLDDVTLHWKIFADSAPPNGGSVQLGGPTLIERIHAAMVASARL